jgi:amidase
MNFDEYRQLDGLGLAKAVERGETTAAELLALARARAAAVNPQINAIVIDMAAEAKARTKLPLQGPFAGVPFLIKDLIQDYAGVPTTYGSRALRDNVPTQHAYMVERWLKAGLVIFGKTNTPELGLKGITEPLLWGPCRNPWQLDHTPGGSSGGSAAAVAAGIVPMAGANDGGGSIRIPAAMCGLFGFRPGRGRVSVGPAVGEVWEGASSDGVVSVTVRDAAAMLDVMSGPESGDPYRFAVGCDSFLQHTAQPPRPLRIAYCHRSPLGAEVHPEHRAAVERTAAQLVELGHHVEAAEPEIDGQALARAYFHLYFGQVAASVAEALAEGAREGDFELETRVLALLGRAISAGDYVLQHRLWNQFSRALGRFYGNYDLYLTPSLAQPPARLGTHNMPQWQQLAVKPLLAVNWGSVLLKTGVVEQMANEQLSRVPFTQLANLTGTPSMSVPLHQADDGLPIGVLFNGPVGGEATMLQLAAQLESAHPWSQRRPLP